jgi:lysyl-tRNA synthetase class 2
MKAGVPLAGINIDVTLTGRFLGDPGQRGGFLVLAGLLGGFLFIRTSARMIRANVKWWPGNVQTGGGLHIHHLVWGIVTVMATGFLGFAFEPASPWREILEVLFGIGCGLTLDEFALWLHLEDVYWTEEGRSSVDAVIVAVIVGGLVVAGAAPFDTGQGGGIAVVTGAVVLTLVFVVISIAKGKRFTALLGVCVPIVAIAGSVRLARPHSRWAKRRYAVGSRKAEEAARRDARVRRVQDRLLNVIAGKPSDELAS